MVRVSGISTSVVSGRFWCAAILTAAGAIGVTSRADAALYDWQDSESGFYRSGPTQARRQKVRLHSGKKEAVEKETTAKPQGPLIIAVSIGRQHVKIYDANGFFAEAPVSTGMPGHSTPTGVFSVIQKHKLHHSNIYSNAPMPYMQRITWSGVALHAGVLPGYPASHGCIRMPMGFAVKMWNWTKMGARVIVAPGEIATPVNFSHPLLPSLKVAPQPVVAEEPHADAPLAAKADKGAPEVKPSTVATNPELRSTVGHGNTTPAAGVTAVTLRDQTHTADAADAKRIVTMSDASSGNKAPDHAAAADSAKIDAANADAAPSTRDAAVDAPAKEAKPTETTTADTKPVAADASDKPEAKSEAKPEAKADAPKPEIADTEPTKTEPAKIEPAKADAAKSNDKPAQAVKAASEVGASAPDGKKDPTRLVKPEAPKRTGQIAVFISRKDSRIYVRQNFAPLFEAPVTIAPSDRPLGTHIFTAEVDKTDANALHWSVVSLPASVRSAMRADEEERGSRRRKNALAPAEAKLLPVPDSAAEALDRIAIPPDTMARVSEALTTGGSIIVSDQGVNQGETGEGTDFIVSLR
jgi:lipoprotein-anchoring transpeptidase ErfK/SrfK